MTAVDWYGLGAFGLPMACRGVASGYTVRAGSERSQFAEFVEAGGLRSTAEVQSLPIVALCLPSATEVLDVVRDLETASCMVDFSSHDPLSPGRRPSCCAIAGSDTSTARSRGAWSSLATGG